ncbi:MULTISPECIES: beta-glucosidase [unclassified Microcoleus]|uniref:beta-glucosidase n=1 Tax=unclassified Microcoleus TaxID=2642155 RepID=UPI002FD19ADF
MPDAQCPMPDAQCPMPNAQCPMPHYPLPIRSMFQSFFMGGFECSTHKLRSGKRLDVTAATGHDKFAAADYQRLQQQGIYTVREGLRWHLIEQTPGKYDFSSSLPIIRAARDMKMQVIWDLFHYGWPDDIDIFSPEFVSRFASMVRAFMEVLTEETDQTPFVTPVNEISFIAWAGGDVAYINPFAKGRGDELKVQLIKASIAAIESVWEVNPRTRIVQIDPTINIIADPDKPEDRDAAEGYRLSQYQAWDMLAGRFRPELGGKEKYLDIIGVNYYDRNQWIHNEEPMKYTDPLYRPFREMLQEVFERYGRPLFIAETGTEDDFRPVWFNYVCTEVAAAMKAGVPIEGICLYPIVNHPGWDDDRHCYNGLWDYCNESGDREIYQPLADELQFQRQQIEPLLKLQN